MDSQAYRQDELPGIAEAVREALRPDMVRVAPGRHAWVPAPHMAGRGLASSIINRLSQHLHIVIGIHLHYL